MKILFIYSVDDVQSSSKLLRAPDSIPFGISYVSAVLKQHGHETRLAVLSRALGARNRRIVDERLMGFEPSLVCLTAVSTQYSFIADVAKYIKSKRPDLFLLIGGVHVSLNASDEMLDVFDAVCIGEGEYASLELVTQLESGVRPSRVSNLWVRHGNTTEKTPPRPFLQDLDNLPFPDREMWEEWVDEQPDSRHTVLLGRGCPFGCTYCSNHALRGLAPGAYVRFRSPENIVAEIRDLKASHPRMGEVYLEVESFSTKVNWATELCKRLEDLNATLERPLAYGVNIRVAANVDFDRLFAACKASNFTFLNVGLESGSERIRREVLRRSYSNDDVKKVVGLAKKHGLRVAFYNMVGLPGETPRDFRDTIRMNRECMPDWHYLEIFYPYPGTALHELCVSNGWIKGVLDTRMERSKAVLDLPDFNRRQIRGSYTWFDYHVYKGRKPFWRILLHVAARRLKSLPGLFYFYRRMTRRGPLKRLKDVAKNY